MPNPKLVVHRDPEVLGGTPVGTRVPVRILFATLELAREVIASDAHPA